MNNKENTLEVQLNYFVKENRRLRNENDRLELENIGLREIIESVSESRIRGIKTIKNMLEMESKIKITGSGSAFGRLI